MKRGSRPDLWKVVGYYVNICLGHTPPYLRFCSYAHLRHLGYTVDDLYSCQSIVVVSSEGDSSYDPLILSTRIFEYVATDKTISVEHQIDQALILRVLETVSNLQLTEKVKCVPIGAVIDQLLDSPCMEQSEILRHIDVLVEHRWLQKSWPTNVHIGVSIPGHSEILNNLKHSEETIRRRLLHDSIPFLIVPRPVRYAPLIREHSFGSGGKHVQPLPIDLQAVYGTEYHIASLLGNKSFTICSTERCTYIGLGDIFH